jgi:hypothetical protein
MAKQFRLTGRLIAAARALTGIRSIDLADAAGIPLEELDNMEAAAAAFLPPGAEVESVRRELEKFGVIFIPENDGFGAGVRLRLTRQDVRQISRLEAEGGPAPKDDVV